MATVEMKTHVTQLLFKQDLRLLLLCWEHNQPLCSAGHYCSAGSLCSRPKYVQRALCTWICFLSLHQPEAAVPELGCSACTAAAAVQSLMHWSPCQQLGMASLSAPPPRASSPHGQLDVHPNRQANRLDAGNPAIWIVVLNSSGPLPVASIWKGSKGQK